METVMITDIGNWTVQFINNRTSAKDNTVKSVYDEVIKRDTAIVMGKVAGKPERLLTPTDHSYLKRYGYNTEFSIS